VEENENNCFVEEMNCIGLIGFMGLVILILYQPKMQWNQKRVGNHTYLTGDSL